MAAHMSVPEHPIILMQKINEPESLKLTDIINSILEIGCV